MGARYLVSITIVLMILFAVPKCDASTADDEALSIWLSHYDEQHFLIAQESGQNGLGLSFYARGIVSAKKIWDITVGPMKNVRIISLPGIKRIALVAETDALVLNSEGSCVFSTTYDAQSRWGLPETSPNQCAAVLGNDSNTRYLVITEAGIDSIGKGTFDREDELFFPAMHVNDEGELFLTSQGADTYYMYADERWEKREAAGCLVYVDDRGPWTLCGEEIWIGDTPRIELPSPRGRYEWESTKEGTGFVLIDSPTDSAADDVWAFDSILVSAVDMEYGIWKGQLVDRFFSLSDTMRHGMIVGDWVDNRPAPLLVWDREHGERMISRSEEMIYSGPLDVSPTYLQYDDGQLLFIGSAEMPEKDAWQLWSCSKDRREFLPIELT